LCGEAAGLHRLIEGGAAHAFSLRLIRMIDSEDLRRVATLERKARLSKLLRKAPSPSYRFEERPRTLGGRRVTRP
jgi:hypothetical protein